MPFAGRVATVDTPVPVRRLSATDWALRVGVAAVFAVFAAEKLVGSTWIALFEALGFGQWFRHVTGALQLGGAVLLLIPSTARMGGALIGCTMVSAMFCHVFLLDTGVGGAIIPAALLLLVVAAAWAGRGAVGEEVEVLRLH